MRQQFYKNTIQSKLIKAILSNTYIPRYDSVHLGSYELRRVDGESNKLISHGSYLIESYPYIYKNKLILCTKSGYLGEDAQWDQLSEYFLNDKDPKISQRYVSRYDYYDSETHLWLGKYLRYIRDVYDIDLMKYYNCFCDQYLTALDIKDTGVTPNIQCKDKIAKIPIKFNQTYSIALDSPSLVKIAPVLMNNFGLLNIIGVKENINTELFDLFKNKVSVSYDSSSFKHLLHINVDITAEDELLKKTLYRYQDDLYLLILIPLNVETSLVVLEGNYSDKFVRNVFSFEDIDAIGFGVVNNLCVSNLSLLQFNDKVNYPFSDRLIEHLLNNTITNRTENSKDISDTQKKLPRVYEKTFYSGDWTDYLRGQLYNFYMNEMDARHLDVDGFVDKDIESLLDRKGFPL